MRRRGEGEGLFWGGLLISPGTPEPPPAPQRALSAAGHPLTAVFSPAQGTASGPVAGPRWLRWCSWQPTPPRWSFPKSLRCTLPGEEGHGDSSALRARLCRCSPLCTGRCPAAPLGPSPRALGTSLAVPCQKPQPVPTTGRSQPQRAAPPAARADGNDHLGTDPVPFPWVPRTPRHPRQRTEPVALPSAVVGE